MASMEKNPCAKQKDEDETVFPAPGRWGQQQAGDFPASESCESITDKDESLSTVKKNIH